MTTLSGDSNPVALAEWEVTQAVHDNTFWGFKSCGFGQTESNSDCSKVSLAVMHQHTMSVTNIFFQPMEQIVMVDLNLMTLTLMIAT